MSLCAVLSLFPHAWALLLLLLLALRLWRSRSEQKGPAADPTPQQGQGQGRGRRGASRSPSRSPSGSPARGRPGAVYEIRPKHQSSVKNNILSGVTLGCWLPLLWRHGADVEWLRYWPRLCFLSAMSLLNSAVGWVEWALFARFWRRQPLPPAPVFILGHPRTGTTLLHNLLSRDSRNFIFCSTFQVGFPSTFLSLGGCRSLLAPMLDPTRPMDNMALDFDLPQEDELATNVLSGGVSPYMPIVFMKQQRRFARFFSFRDPSVDRERRHWLECFRDFLRKVTWSAAGRARTEEEAGAALAGRRLLLKSPCHTSRVELLLREFPDAQFVYLHRDPYTVFQSAAHMADSTYWYSPCAFAQPLRICATGSIEERRVGAGTRTSTRPARPRSPTSSWSSSRRCTRTTSRRGARSRKGSWWSCRTRSWRRTSWRRCGGSTGTSAGGRCRRSWGSTRRASGATGRTGSGGCRAR